MVKTILILVALVVVVGGLFFIGRGTKLEVPDITSGTTDIGGDNNTSNSEKPGVVNTYKPPVTPTVREFTVEAKNFSFTPSTIKVKKGDRVKITFKNTGGFHDFRIDEYKVASKQSQSPTTEILEFTANKTGSFEYYCSVGTHRAMGMKGVLIVE